MAILENPELLRYVRSELRPARAMAIISSVLGILCLVALICYQSALDQRHHLDVDRFWAMLHGVMFMGSCALLLLWTALACSNSVVGERTHRTFDFWRTTRLASSELTLGKLFGPPLGAWLQYLSIFPVFLVTGMMAHHPLTKLLVAYFSIALFAVTVGAVSLCGSVRAVDTRRAQLALAILFLPLLRQVFPTHNALDQNAWGALTPFWGVEMLYTNPRFQEVSHVLIFGHAVSFLLVSTILQLVIIAFCVAALLRSIKYEPSQRSLFSPVQVVLLAAAFLVFSYAAFRPTLRWVPDGSYTAKDYAQVLTDLLATATLVSFIAMYVAISLTVVHRDTFRTWLRNRTPFSAIARLTAPWLATAVIALVAAMSAVIGYSHRWDHTPIPWSGFASLAAAILIYAVRDGLFIQFIATTKIKAPVLKAFLLTVVYYTAAIALAGAIGSTRGDAAASHIARWLTPMVAGDELSASVEVVFALLLPLATTGFLASRLVRRNSRASKALHVTAAA